MAFRPIPVALRRPCLSFNSSLCWDAECPKVISLKLICDRDNVSPRDRPLQMCERDALLRQHTGAQLIVRLSIWRKTALRCFCGLHIDNGPIQELDSRPRVEQHRIFGPAGRRGGRGLFYYSYINQIRCIRDETRPIVNAQAEVARNQSATASFCVNVITRSGEANHLQNCTQWRIKVVLCFDAFEQPRPERKHDKS
jgi:hypothetical protein